MRLRTRLALAFALIALLPLGLVVPLAIRDLRATLSGELSRRADGAVAAANAALAQDAEELRRSVEELSESVALEELAKGIHGNDLPELTTAGERLMKSRGLSVLALFSSDGRTLTSGHLPARLGDPDPALFAITRAAPQSPTPLMVELRDEQGLKSKPAIAFARPMDYGDLRIWIVGGQLLDSGLAERLSRITAARVEIRDAQKQLVGSAGEAPPPSVTRTLSIGDASTIELRFSRAALLRAEQDLIRAFAVVAFVGLLFSVLLGILLARRVTRPVEALTEATRKIGVGQLQAQVQVAASGEVGELVSAFNRMTSDLEKATSQLVATERVAAWQEVARRLAHELKNPLTPIKMSLETLLAAKAQQSPRFDALFQESAGAVLEEVERLRRIVDEFSRFARLPKPDRKRCDLSELLGQVLSLYASPPPGIRLIAEIAPGLLASADRDQLTQVLVNLVKNAEEVLPGGGQIFVRGRKVAGEVQLEVEDSGPGVRLEDRKNIFEPYFTTKQGGTGLGLAIAARICQEHGGRLEVTGEPDQGARFVVSLPALEN